MDDVNPFLELQPVKFQRQEQKEERLGGVFVWIHEQCILQADHLHIYSQLPRSSQHILSMLYFINKPLDFLLISFNVID